MTFIVASFTDLNQPFGVKTMPNPAIADDFEALDTSRLPPNARLRSGTAARLAGLPVTTLRVWERRYAVVAAPKTATGQRLYSTVDVQRLALLKQLSDRGHAIGTIASLSLPELQGLAATTPARSAASTMPGLDLIVVGRSAAQKLHAVGASPRAVHDDLTRAEAEVAIRLATGSTPAAGPDVLLVHLPSLHPALAERALSLAKQSRAATLMVLYAFGAETVAESLRAAGAIVRREPCTGRELSRLLAAAAQSPSAATGLPATSTRRYSDEQLASLAEQPSTVLCECPRHLAEIVSQLAHLEQYSAECDASSPADSALHRHLGGLAGAARAMFEQALDRVVAEEGLSV
jgi:MerR family transcriptional regulator, light-induced transcriptional regulator